MLTTPIVPVRMAHVLVGILAAALVGSGSAARAADPSRGGTTERSAPCDRTSTDAADFPRMVPLPAGDYTVRGYLRVDCKHLLDLALEVDDLRPENRELVRGLRAKGFSGVTSSSRTVEVVTGPDSEPEMRKQFKVRAVGHGYRVKVELGFVGAAPRWSGTALIRYVVRPLR